MENNWKASHEEFEPENNFLVTFSNQELQKNLLENGKNEKVGAEPFRSLT